MTTMRIKLLNTRYGAEFIVPLGDEESIRTAEWVLENDDYLILPQMLTEKSGLHAVEDVYDLTNNPARQEERRRLYGNGRPITVGDVVEVDGVNYLCDFTKWLELPSSTN